MGDLWLYEWPNGQASIVYAEDEQGVVQLLDELGSADEALVQPYDGDFFVTFTPTLNPETKEPEWQADPYDHAEDIFEVVLEDPEAAILKYGEGTVDKTASLVVLQTTRATTPGNRQGPSKPVSRPRRQGDRRR